MLDHLFGEESQKWLLIADTPIVEGLPFSLQICEVDFFLKEMSPFHIFINNNEQMPIANTLLNKFDSFQI